MSPFIAYDNILYPVGYFVNPILNFYLIHSQNTKRNLHLGFHLPPNFEVEDEKYQYTTRSGTTVPYNLKPPSTFFTLYLFPLTCVLLHTLSYQVDK